ncbi:hypothetical protein GIY62_06370 [Burkholderia plantarii]|uniref:hypothetical protein n=1 Tax=Burkholderia plantarii TaxID=41899 RepID=UPI00272D46FE|nr:hypothetical protein [Burkholderia plantarii]WLE60279.1 hypothetical protein GIY62_06370 [Burkholderia plantarii]
MTVPVQNPTISYTGNGATKAFPFPFTILSSADVVVLLDGVPQSLGAQYTLDGIGNQSGGTATFSVTPTAGAAITIYRDVAIERDTDYQDNGDLLADTVNADFDRLWMAMQDSAASLDRAVRVPRSDVNPSMTLPTSTQRANKALGFDADGDPFMIQLAIGSVPSPVVNSIAMLRLVTVATPVFVTGYRGSSDGGGGPYQPMDVGDMRPDNGGTIIRTATGIGFELQLTGPVTPEQFGAYGDGVLGQNVGHDDADALQRWHDALSPTLAGDWGASVYNTSRPITKTASNITIRTAGQGNTVLNYIGTATDVDILVYGTAGTDSKYWNVGGISIETATKMTAGAAVRIKQFMTNNIFDGFSCGTLTNSDKLWHGVWLDHVNVFYLTTVNAVACQGDGLRLNGRADNDDGSDVYITRGNISFCAIGLHQGGGMGGLRTGQLNCFNNNYNYYFDTSIVARKNREVFLEAGSVCDGATIAGIVFDDTLTSNAPIFVNLFVASSGQLGASGPCHGLWIKHWPNGYFTLGVGQVFNHIGDGIRVEDVTINMSIASEAQIRNNGGYGVNATARWYNCFYYNGYMAFNVAGDFHPNTGCSNGATVSVTVTAASGALGAYSASVMWTTTGKTVVWELFISITNIGTASGLLTVGMPFQSRLAVAAAAVDELRGMGLSAFMSSNSTILNIAKYDGTFAAINGSVLSATAGHAFL